jgi:MFS family permease
LDPYAPFRSRDFRFFLTGSFLSNLGLQMLSVAVSWDLYVQTKSAAVLGNVGFVQVAPFLVFALAAGHIADRYDRRRIMLATQVVVIAAAVLLIVAPPSVLFIYTTLFLNAAARSFQGPARLAILPHVVPSDALGRAITWHSSAQEIANVGGPALAGLLLATMGSKIVYGVQLGCAVLTFLCVFLLSVRLKPVVVPSGAPAASAQDRHQLLEGVRFVWRDPLILPAISLDLFGVLFGGAVALLPIYAVEILHTDARGLGWLRAATSIGAVSMALLLSHMPKAKKPGRLLLLAVAGFGAATIVFGLSRSLWLSFAMLLLTGAFDNVSVVLRQSLVQMRTPDYLKGRVLAVQNIFISCSNQLGAVESGWTAAWFGPVISVVGGGIATIAIVGGFAMKSTALRLWTQTPETQSEVKSSRT